MTTMEGIKCNQNEKKCMSCVCVCYEYGYIQVHMHVRDAGQAVVSFFRSLLPCFLRWSLSLAGVRWFA